MNSQTFGEKIREERIKNGFSIRQLSKPIGYNEKSLSKIERGLMLAPIGIVEPLSEALKISCKELITIYLSKKIFSEVAEINHAKEAIEIVLKRLERGQRGTKELKKREIIFQEIKKGYGIAWYTITIKSILRFCGIRKICISMIYRLI